MCAEGGAVPFARPDAPAAVLSGDAPRTFLLLQRLLARSHQWGLWGAAGRQQGRGPLCPPASPTAPGAASAPCVQSSQKQPQRASWWHQHPLGSIPSPGVRGQVPALGAPEGGTSYVLRGPLGPLFALSVTCKQHLFTFPLLKHRAGVWTSVSLTSPNGYECPQITGRCFWLL